MLKDAFGRMIDNLRISVTDRCNLRCFYCMPEEGLEWFDKSKILTFEEIERLVGIFASLGVKKVRLTGGEPLVRKDLEKLVERLAKIPGIKDIGMTTNGILLSGYAQKLFDAGMRRINVSLDSFDPKVFFEITKRNQFQEVIKGIEAAEKACFSPIKINIVPIRGINDNEILAFGHFARKTGFEVRFIEFMPIGTGEWTLNDVVPTSEIKEKLSEIAPLVSIEHDTRLPADEFIFADGIGKVGFIASVTEPFCGSCNRVRITADGKFRTCLFSVVETDLLELLRNGTTDEKIAEILTGKVWEKEAGHLINQDAFVKPMRSMSQIGG